MKEAKEPFHLLDLLKLLTLFSIQTLHAWEFVFYQDKFLLQDKSVLYDIFQYLARCFSLGGQVLVAIIYFLFAFSGKSRGSLLRIMGFAMLGQAALTLAFLSEQGLLASIEWDIYFFIVLCNLVLLFLPRSSLTAWSLMVVGCLVLAISPSLWQGMFPTGWVFDILTGRLTTRNAAAWAPLPWLFHALLFYGVGLLCRKHPEFFRHWHKSENFLWPLLLLLALPQLGYYFRTPIGPNYYAFNFHQHPLTYWSNFLPFVLWMRLSLIAGLQRKLHCWRPMRWISSLMWVRKVGLSYLIGVLYVGAGAQLDEVLSEVPYAFDIFYASIMPVVELLVRLLVSLKSRLRPSGGQKLAPPPGDVSAR